MTMSKGSKSSISWPHNLSNLSSPSPPSICIQNKKRWIRRSTSTWSFSSFQRFHLLVPSTPDTLPTSRMDEKSIRLDQLKNELMSFREVEGMVFTFGTFVGSLFILYCGRCNFRKWWRFSDIALKNITGREILAHNIEGSHLANLKFFFTIKSQKIHVMKTSNWYVV
jgi:hypothetical protein